MTSQFFEDIHPGVVTEFPPYHVDGGELLQFNLRWDRLPIHTDDAAARRQGHRGIIASGQFTLCIKQHFINQADWRDAVIGAAGWDRVRFQHPVYAGDDISARIRCVDKTESRSKPDRGIVKFEITLMNQDNKTVLSLLDNVMIRKQPAK
jgi:acyl dehydratase